MLDYNSGSLAAAIFCLVVAIALTFPSIYSIISHFREKGKQNANTYTDKDGVATEETIAAFSTKVPKTLLIISTFFGLGTSLTLAILDLFHDNGLQLEDWINVAIWVSCIHSHGKYIILLIIS